MIRTLSSAALVLAVALPVSAIAQQQQAAAAGPQVGEVAPDFALPGATRDGVRSTPIKLSDYKGKSVVIAFFPAARTRGCTVQMETYRDKFATLFHGGTDVVVIGISADADTTLASWAKEANFPMLFASDVEHKAGDLYGASKPNAKYLSRFLYIVGPDGRIAYRMTPFNAMAEDAYAELGKAVEAATGTK